MKKTPAMPRGKPAPPPSMPMTQALRHNKVAAFPAPIPPGATPPMPMPMAKPPKKKGK